MADNTKKLDLDDLDEVTGGVGIINCTFNKNLVDNKAKKDATLSTSKSKKDIKFFDTAADKPIKC